MPRISLNKDINTKNVIEHDEYLDIGIQTCKDIQRMILPLCGKMALNNLVVFKDDLRDYLGNVFSNDGIHVLKNIEYVNPVQTFISNYVRYIAERVENAAADGTSTAIYFAATFLECALSNIKADIVKGDRDNRTKSFCKERMLIIENTLYFFNEMIPRLKEDIKRFIIQTSELDYDLRKNFIFHLANTTTKGNTDLSDYVVTLFSDIPELLYQYISYKQSPNETDVDFSIEEVDCDFDIRVALSANTVYNQKLQTEILYEDCIVLPIPNINPMNAKALVEYIDTIKNDNPEQAIIVIVNGADDASNVYLEKNLNRENIVFSRYVAPNEVLQGNPLEIHALQVVCEREPINPISVKDIEKGAIHNVRCHIANHVIKLSNLFSGESNQLHPFFVDKSYDPYTKLCKEVESQIVFLESAHHLQNKRTQLEEFVRIYKKLVCNRLPNLLIGGSSVDHIHNINIVDDVLGAVSVALKHGFIVDGMSKFYLITSRFFCEYRTNYPEYADIIERIDNSFLTFLKVIYCDMNHNHNDSDFADMTSCYVDNDFFARFTKLSIIDQCSGNLFVEDEFNRAGEGEYIVQSALSFKEFFRRLEETIPKLIKTNAVTVRNGIAEKE